MAMKLKRTNYLNLTALMKAEKEGLLFEQLELQRQTNSSGMSAESFCIELLKMDKTKKRAPMSVNDVIRKEFHTNY